MTLLGFLRPRPSRTEAVAASLDGAQQASLAKLTDYWLACDPQTRSAFQAAMGEEELSDLAARMEVVATFAAYAAHNQAMAFIHRFNLGHVCRRGALRHRVPHLTVSTLQRWCDAFAAGQLHRVGRRAAPITKGGGAK